MSKIENFFGWKTSDGAVHPTLSEAQANELTLLPGMPTNDIVNEAAKCLVANADEVIEILSEKPTTKPKRKKRSDAGRKREKPA